MMTALLLRADQGVVLQLAGVGGDPAGGAGHHLAPGHTLAHGRVT